jgi:hypothetical protein
MAHPTSYVTVSPLKHVKHVLRFNARLREGVSEIEQVLV